MLPLKRLALIGLVTYSILLMITICFFKERVVFVDISFQLFLMIKGGYAALHSLRFGSLFTLFFPLLAIKLQLPLSWIAMSWNIAVPLFFAIIFFLILLLFNDVKMAMLVLLFNTLMVTHSFYWLQSELPQAVAFLILFFSFCHWLLQKKELPFYASAIIAIMLFTLSFYHPLIIFAFSFISLFLILSPPPHTHIHNTLNSNNNQNERKFYTINLLVFFVFYFIKAWAIPSLYEAEAMNHLQSLIDFFPNYLNLDSFHLFWKYLFHDYYFLLVGLLLISFYYLKKFNLFNLFKLLFVLGFFCGYLLIENVVYYNCTAQFYIENQYLLLGFFVGVPLVFDVIPSFKKEWITSVAISLVCLIGVIRIYNAHTLYTNRLNWCQNLLDKTENLSNKKLILKKEQAPLDTLIMTWGCPTEFWLLSMLEKNEARSIVIENIPNEFSYRDSCNHCFVGIWKTFKYDELTKKYFNFNDTTQYVYYKQ